MSLKIKRFNVNSHDYSVSDEELEQRVIKDEAIITELSEIIKNDEHPNYAIAFVDSEGEILGGINGDGEWDIPHGIPADTLKALNSIQTNMGVMEDGVVELQDTIFTEDTDMLISFIDAKRHVLGGVKPNGEWYIPKGVPTDVKVSMDEIRSRFNSMVQEYDLRFAQTDASLNVVQDAVKDIEYMSDAILADDNPNYVIAFVDNAENILGGITPEGEWIIPHGIPTDTKHILDDLKSSVKQINESTADVKDVISVKDADMLLTFIDSDEHVLGGIKTNGEWIIPKGVPTELKDVAQTVADINESLTIIEDDAAQFLFTIMDSDDTILWGVKRNGVIYQPKGVPDEVQSVINNHNDRISDLEKAMADGNFKTATDWSESEYINIPTPKCAVINIHSDFDLTQLSKAGRGGAIKGYNYEIPTIVEFWDMQGNYFKKWCLMSGQGNSSMGFIKKNIAFDFLMQFADKYDSSNDDAFSIKFGKWVSQDSFHCKAYYTDFFRGVGKICYDICDIVTTYNKTPYEDRVWKKALIDSKNYGTGTNDTIQTDDISLQIDGGARCFPDGFPCVIYQNGKFYGVFSFQLKKHRDNMHMVKDNPKHIHLDGTIADNTLFAANGDASKIGWIPGNDNGFEVRNPKDFVTYLGTLYNADAATSQELAGIKTLDEEIEVWNATKGYVKGDICKSADGKHVYFALSDSVGADPSKANYKKPTKPFDKATEWWVEITFTNEAKKHIMEVSTFVPKLKELEKATYESDELKVATIKEYFETHFDVINIIDYLICISLVGDGDSLRKNWQWTTYDGIKWWANPYDMDGAFGAYHIGNYVNGVSSRSLMYGSKELPTGWVYEYYKPQIKARWQELCRYDGNIADETYPVTPNKFFNLLKDWCQRIGQDNFENEYEKWNESPCNRDSLINDEQWSRIGGYVQGWSATTTYAANAYIYKSYSNDYIYYVCKSTEKDNKGNHPLFTDNWSIVDIVNVMPTDFAAYTSTTTYNKDALCYVRMVNYRVFKSRKSGNLNHEPIVISDNAVDEWWTEITFDMSKIYKNGDIIYFGYGTNMYQFKCISTVLEGVKGVMPTKHFYQQYPQTLGHRDNLFRIYNWLSINIKSLNDNILKM